MSVLCLYLKEFQPGIGTLPVSLRGHHVHVDKCQKQFITLEKTPTLDTFPPELADVECERFEIHDYGNFEGDHPELGVYYYPKRRCYGLVKIQDSHWLLEVRATSFDEALQFFNELVARKIKPTYSYESPTLWERIRSAFDFPPNWSWA